MFKMDTDFNDLLREMLDGKTDSMLDKSDKSVATKNYCNEAMVTKPFKIINYEVYDNKTTVVWFNDGTKTTAVCTGADTFDLEEGIKTCIIKKIFPDYRKMIKSCIKQKETVEKIKERKKAYEQEQKEKRARQQEKKRLEKEKYKKAKTEEMLKSMIPLVFEYLNNKECAKELDESELLKKLFCEYAKSQAEEHKQSTKQSKNK